MGVKKVVRGKISRSLLERKGDTQENRKGGREEGEEGEEMGIL